MIKAYFINSPYAEYTDEEFAWFQSELLTEGIIGDPETGVMGYKVVENSPTVNMETVIESGKALMEIEKDGRVFKIVIENTEEKELLHGDNGTIDDRVDTIIIEVDTEAAPDETKSNIGSVEIIKGDGETAKSDEDINSELGHEYWIRLADVTVEPSATAINDNNIEDKRTKIKFSEAWEREFNPIEQEGDLVVGDTEPGSAKRIPFKENKLLTSSNGEVSWRGGIIPEIIESDKVVSNGHFISFGGLTLTVPEDSKKGDVLNFRVADELDIKGDNYNYFIRKDNYIYRDAIIQSGMGELSFNFSGVEFKKVGEVEVQKSKNDAVYFHSDRYGRVYKIEKETGNVVWINTATTSRVDTCSTLAVDSEGNIYYINSDNNVVKADTSGGIIWIFNDDETYNGVIVNKYDEVFAYNYSRYSRAFKRIDVNFAPTDGSEFDNIVWSGSTNIYMRPGMADPEGNLIFGSSEYDSNTDPRLMKTCRETGNRLQQLSGDQASELFGNRDVECLALDHKGNPIMYTYESGLLKIDGDDFSNVIWQKPNINVSRHPTSINTLPNSNFVVYENGMFRAFDAKTGEEVKALFSPADAPRYGSFRVDGIDKAIYSMDSDDNLVKYDFEGNKLWTKTEDDSFNRTHILIEDGIFPHPNLLDTEGTGDYKGLWIQTK